MIRGLEEMAIIKPTELQKKVIPFLLRDGATSSRMRRPARAIRRRLACHC